MKFFEEKDLCDEAGYLLNPEYLVEKLNHRTAYLCWEKNLGIKQLDRVVEVLKYVLGPTRDVKTPKIQELLIEAEETLRQLRAGLSTTSLS